MAEQFAAIDAIVEAFEVLNTAGSFDDTLFERTEN